MKLNHINLVVENVTAFVSFLERYFGFKCMETKGNNVVAILKSADDFTLVVMVSKNNEAAYPEAFHIGFMQDSMDAVSNIYNNLKANGIDVVQEPKKIRNSFGFYFKFDNIMIEVGHYL